MKNLPVIYDIGGTLLKDTNRISPAKRLAVLCDLSSRDVANIIFKTPLYTYQDVATTFNIDPALVKSIWEESCDSEKADIKLHPDTLGVCSVLWYPYWIAFQRNWALDCFPYRKLSYEVGITKPDLWKAVYDDLGPFIGIGNNTYKDVDACNMLPGCKGIKYEST